MEVTEKTLFATVLFVSLIAHYGDATLKGKALKFLATANYILFVSIAGMTDIRRKEKNIFPVLGFSEQRRSGVSSTAASMVDSRVKRPRVFG